MIHNNFQDDPYSFSPRGGPDPSSVGFVLNLLLIVGVVAIGVLKLEQDWAWYKSELLIYHSVQDGLTPEDMPKQDMAMQLRNLMEFKGVSQEKFFFSKWLPLLPGYLLALLVPLALGLIRLRSRGKDRLRLWYIIFFGVFVLYGSFFLAIYFGLLRL